MFKLNTKVKIINTRETYSHYDELANILELEDFKVGKEPKEGEGGIITHKSFHGLRNKDVVYCVTTSKGQFLMAEGGIEEYKVDWSKVKVGSLVKVWDEGCPLEERVVVFFVGYIPELNGDCKIITSNNNPLKCSSFTCSVYRYGEVL